MKITIVGGGNVGYYLVKTLASEKHNIMVIEVNPILCERIARELDSKYVEVTCGDGTNIKCLKDADIFKSDVVIAVTGQDQTNFVACQFAKQYFGVKLTISRVNNPKNIKIFEKMGVDSVISSTARIASIINQELDWTEVSQIVSAKTTNIRIKEINVEEHSKVEKKSLEQIMLPKDMIVVSIIRGDDVIVPNGLTKLHADDIAIMLGKASDFEDVIKLFSRQNEV